MPGQLHLSEKSIYSYVDMHRTVWRHLGVIGLTLLCGASTQPIQNDVAALMQQLSADNWSARQQAEQSLVRLGDAAEPALKSALKHPIDPETQSRIEDAIAQIETNRVNGPSIVSLDYDSADAKTILDDLGRQAHAKIELGIPGWVGPGAVTIHVHRVPFWVAMKTLCDKTNMSPRFDNEQEALTVGPGTDFISGIAHDDGAFMVIARRIVENAELSFAPGQVTHRTMSLEMTMLAEPKLMILGHAYVPHIQTAIDDIGNSLESRRGMFRGFNPMFVQGMNADSSHVWMCGLQLQEPNDHAKKIARLKGTFRMAMANGFETWTIPDVLKVQSLTKMFGAASYSIDSITQDNTNYVVRISGVRSGTNVDDSFLGLGQIDMVDDKGQSLQRRPMGGGGATGRLQYTFSFDSNDPMHPAGKPSKLIWKVPTATKIVEIPFEFRDLPLP
ncbi:MAG TPA: hypothetical protein VGG19_05780 [Tepidisphaeraceae bacterium]|jgi:hypothetical protein